MRSSAILLAFAVLPQLSSCGWSAAAFQLRGELAGESLETSVDSPIARYYVDAYLTGRRHNKSWDDALDAIHRDLGENVPSTEQLKVWTRSHSADLAALVFAHQVLRQSRDEALLRVFREELVTVQASHRAGNLESVRIDPDVLILFVPGWLYKADTTTGADFARFRALLSRHGASVSLVETGQNLAVEDNARLIEDRIRHAGRSGKAIVVVSGSKGGPEVALALSNLRQDPDARQVKAWLNIGGLMAGTPLADTALTWPTCWFVYLAVLPDSSFDGIRSVSTARSTARRKDLELPADVLVVNYVAVPLSGDISRQASEGYRRLRADGPNDGLTYLPDAIVPDSVTIPEIGVDHYFRAANIDLRAIALTRAIVRHAKNTPMAQHDVSYRRVRTSNGEHGLAVGELYRGIRGGMPLTPNR